MSAQPTDRTLPNPGWRPFPWTRFRVRRAVCTGAIGLLAAIVSPAPGATQSSVGFSLAIGATAPAHPLFIGATPGAHSVGMVSAGMVSAGVVSTGVAWGHHQTAWGHGSPRSWRHRSASRLTPSCWSAWKDPWFAHWPYCDAGGFAAWTWMPAVHPWGWTYAHPVPVGFMYPVHPVHAHARSHRLRHHSPVRGWAFAMSVGFGPHWPPPPFWYAGWYPAMVYAPVTVVHVVHRPLWTVHEPPPRSAPRGAPTFGGGGWVTQPEYKEDPGAPPRTATPRGAAAQGPTPTATSTPGPAPASGPTAGRVSDRAADRTSTPGPAPATSAGAPTNGARGVAAPATTPATTPAGTPATTRVPETSRPSTAPARTSPPATGPAPTAPAARGTGPAASSPRAPAAQPGSAPSRAPAAGPTQPSRSAPAAAPSRSAPPAAPAPSAAPRSGSPAAAAPRPATRTAAPASASPAPAPSSPSAARPAPAARANPAPPPAARPAATPSPTPGTSPPPAATRGR